LRRQKAWRRVSKPGEHVTPVHALTCGFADQCWLSDRPDSLDAEEVRGSNPLAPTTKRAGQPSSPSPLAPTTPVGVTVRSNTEPRPRRAETWGGRGRR